MSAEQFYLEAGQGHSLHVETWGNPHGVPVVFLHGGPGSGCNPGQRALFDPECHFAIFVDQRGAGRSLPARARNDNTTAHLIGDLEQLRARLGLDSWFVTGGSWGATLALAYAQSHPARVRGLVLRAVFLGTRAELDAAFGSRLQWFYPDLYAALLAGVAPDQRADPLTALWHQILDPDPAIHRPAAFLWYDIERALSELRPAHSRPQPQGPDRPLPATPFMEAHYFLNDCFLPPGALLKGLGALADIPAVLLQGRYDLLCPPQTTAALAAGWPGAEVVMIEAAGHALSEPGMTAAMAAALARITGTGQG